MQKRQHTKTPYLMVFLLVLLSLPLGAQELGVEDAILLAQETSSTLKSARITLQSAVNEAGINALLPSLDVSLSAQETMGNLLDGQCFNPVVLNFSPSVSWSLSSSLINSEKTKDLKLQSAYLTFAATEASLRSSTESAYWTLALSEESVEEAKRNVSAAETALEKAEALYEASRASSLSILQAKLNLSDAELTLDNAEATYATKRSDFLSTLGLTEDTLVTLAPIPDLTDLDYSKLEAVAEKYLSSTTTIRSAELKYQTQEQSEKTTRDNATLPSVSFSTNLGYTMGYTVGGNLNQSLKLTATAKVSIPLNVYLPSSSSSVTVQNAKLTTEKEAITLETTRKNLEDKVASQIASIRTNVKKRDNLLLHLELAKENLAMVQEAYDQGYSSQSALNDALSSVEKANSSLFSSTSSIITTLVSLSGTLEIDLNTLLEGLK